MPVTVMSGRLAGRVWIGVAALVFSAATAMTIAICVSMASKGGVPMAGGWTMSMAWARMCGQTWGGAATAFVGMWTAMTVAMMLPVLAPALRRSHGAAAGRGGVLCVTGAALAAGYFAVWIGMGAALYPAGTALAGLALRTPALARAVPWGSGVALLMAGWFQASAVKMRYLACCRAATSCAPAARSGARAALRHGVRLGLHCSGCCAGFTVMLLAVGVMDLRAMACAAAAIFAERFAPGGERVARTTGLLIVAAGLVMILRLWARPG
ncbi:DUF2182 domain-containing protein [Paraburkholderia acidipaludis]|uniref:DUF2182 domain-containing protein n=1 Tax=Paraburkholderia acidipaludis TaxID=660537 RepID=UPI0005BC6EBC|nr:DUF2182 domain-containing protein [Paraburkholderia acidipaludis]